MTRIIAGRYAGRRLAVPSSGARPTTDRVREAVFNALTHRLADWSGCRVLDLFAGSGALGLEALSRGAASATFVERDRVALGVLRRNIATMETTGSAHVVAADALRWLPPPGATFDLVLADPPYPMAAAEIAGMFRRLHGAGRLPSDAVLVVERPARDRAAPWPSHWTTEQRRYGETTIWYGRAQEDAAQMEGT